ncbi:hypothetical protein VCHA54O485_150058 [Vibrio chagasii]|nr:hypothetical protein VCHA55P509_140058 [Vibrio chagasii]CAH6987234.1 hypothetical protein VCHA54O485_150058 [Vibrio chagasii]CAH7229471.1 hypothetical protein VCHA54P501_160060 [Vibrio chagasii]
MKNIQENRKICLDFKIQKATQLGQNIVYLTRFGELLHLAQRTTQCAST